MDDLFNKSWELQSRIYKQKSKIQLKKHLRGNNYLDVRKCLYYICVKCIQHDDASCLGSVLLFFANRTMSSNVKLMNEYGLWYLSMKISKKCFEYLVSVPESINKHNTIARKIHPLIAIDSEVSIRCRISGTIRVFESPYNLFTNHHPVLHIACINWNEYAVGVLLKNGANVNEVIFGTRYNAFHSSMLMRLYYKYYTRNVQFVESHNKIVRRMSLNLLDKIIQMLLLAGIDTHAETCHSRIACDGGKVMFSFPSVINETVGSFSENCH